MRAYSLHTIWLYEYSLMITPLSLVKAHSIRRYWFAYWAILYINGELGSMPWSGLMSLSFMLMTLSSRRLNSWYPQEHPLQPPVQCSPFRISQIDFAMIFPMGVAGHCRSKMNREVAIASKCTTITCLTHSCLEIVESLKWLESQTFPKLRILSEKNRKRKLFRFFE